MRDFHNYKVWEKGHQFALNIYRKTKSFPKEEIFGITSQIRRAATSIPFNIAEGCGRRSDAEFAHYLLRQDLLQKSKKSFCFPMI